MRDLFKINTGYPYWMNHLLIALAMGALLGNFFIGAAFYAGREIRDWEKLPDRGFDHPGFWAPVIPCVILQTVILLR